MSMFLLKISSIKSSKEGRKREEYRAANSALVYSSLKFPCLQREIIDCIKCEKW